MKEKVEVLTLKKKKTHQCRIACPREKRVGLKKKSVGSSVVGKQASKNSAGSLHDRKKKWRRRRVSPTGVCEGKLALDLTLAKSRRQAKGQVGWVATS